MNNVDFPFDFEGRGTLKVKAVCKSIHGNYCMGITFKIYDEDDEAVLDLELTKDQVDDILELAEEKLLDEYYNQDVYNYMH